MAEVEPTPSPADGRRPAAIDRLWRVRSSAVDVRRRGEFLILLQVVVAASAVVALPLVGLVGVRPTLFELGLGVEACVVSAAGIWLTRRGHVDLTGSVVSTMATLTLVGVMLRDGGTSPFGWLTAIPVLIAGLSVRPPLILGAYVLAQASLIAVELATVGADPSTFAGRRDVVLMSVLLLLLASVSAMYSATTERVLAEPSPPADGEDTQLVLHPPFAEVVEPRRFDELQALLYVIVAQDAERLRYGAEGWALVDRLADRGSDVEQLALHARPVDVEPLLRQALEAVGPAARGRGNVVRAWLEEGLGTIWSDGTTLYRVVRLLLSDAVRLTERGEIHLRASRPAGARVLRIEVEDTGAGVAPDELERLVEGTATAAPAVLRRHGGLVASVALCRGLGGDLTARSDPGEGSTYTVLLPVGGPSGMVGLSRDQWT